MGLEAVCSILFLSSLSSQHCIVGYREGRIPLFPDEVQEDTLEHSLQVVGPRCPEWLAYSDGDPVDLPPDNIFFIVVGKRDTGQVRGPGHFPVHRRMMSSTLPRGLCGIRSWSSHPGIPACPSRGGSY